MIITFAIPILTFNSKPVHLSIKDNPTRRLVPKMSLMPGVHYKMHLVQQFASTIKPGCITGCGI